MKMFPHVCQCGCGESFESPRKDQMFLSVQHSVDFNKKHNRQPARRQNKVGFRPNSKGLYRDS